MRIEQNGISTITTVVIVVTVVITVVVGVSAAVLLVPKEGAEATPTATPTTTPTTTPPGGDGLKPTALYLKTAESADYEKIGVEAFSIIIPADWQFQGGLDGARKDRCFQPLWLSKSSV